MVDGDPIFQEIEKTPYERVLNTPFFIVKDTKKGVYYINGGMHWYTSENGAAWEYTQKVPKKLEEIAEEALDTGKDGYASAAVEEEESRGWGHYSCHYSEDHTRPNCFNRTVNRTLLPLREHRFSI